MTEKKTKKQKPKQESLPGMEDRKLSELHKLAGEYADARDERMEILKQEVELKGQLLGLMKMYHKETYLCEGVEIRVVHESETVRVKIHKEKEEKAAD